MKKSILLILCLFTFFYHISTNTYPNFLYTPKHTNVQEKSNKYNSKYQDMHESISKKIIRFHVIGNSNSYNDQAIKLKIKDAIIKKYSPLFHNVNNVNCARKIALDNLNNITKTAQEILSNHNLSYSVKTSMSTRHFPIKQYGNTILPAGDYEAVSITLGEASGRNWWCVLYPSLCVIDTDTSTNKTSTYYPSFGNILTPAEYDYITYNPSNKITYTSIFSELFF